MNWNLKISIFFAFWMIQLDAFCQINFDVLNTKLDSVLIQEKIPGCQIVIVNKDSSVWSKNFGFSNLTDSILVNRNTIFRVGSITKSFTAVAALQLHEGNIWTIEDKLKELNPDASLKNNYSTSVTLTHLLEHTSGLDDIRLKEYATSCEKCTTSEGLNYYNTGKYSRWNPGKFMSYSNWGAAYIAEALENKIGDTYEEYVKNQILRPLKMTNADFFLSERVKKNIATGYSGYYEFEPKPYEHILERASGALNASAFELSHFLGMLLNEGRLNDTEILRSESIDLMETTHTTLAAGSGFSKGYGKGLECIMFEGNEWYGHSGAMLGFQSTMFYNKDIGLGYVVLINKDSGIERIEKVIRQHLITKKNIPVNQDFEFDNGYLGYYNTATSKVQMSRFVEYLTPFKKMVKQGDKYFLQSFQGQEIMLSPIGNNVFYHQNDYGNGSAYVFASHQGDKYLQVPMYAENYVKTSFLVAWSRLIIPVLFLIIYLLGLVAIPIATLVALIKRKTKNSWLSLSTWLTIVSFFVMIYCLVTGLSKDAINLMGKPSVWSQGYFIFNIIYLFLGISSCFLIYKNWKKQPKFKKVVNVIFVCAFLVSVVYLGVFEMLGLQTWKY